MRTVNVSYFICIMILIVYHNHTENIIINRFILYNRNLIISAVNKLQFYTNCLVTSPWSKNCWEAFKNYVTLEGGGGGGMVTGEVLRVMHLMRINEYKA